jgi:CBS domain-containing protein/ribosome-associated translation inhibitor RaiA
MRLQEIMIADVITARPDETASAAWSRMEQEGVRHLVVTEGQRLLGVISERDLGGRKGGSVRRGRTVRDLMTAQIATATPATTLRKAANLMHGRLIGSLPVLEDGRLVGIVTATDVLQALGRGSTRPTVRAERRSMRLPPAGARRAVARRTGGAATRGKRTRKRRKGGGKVGKEPVDPGSEPLTGSTSAVATSRMTPTLGRERTRLPDSPKRSPMAASVPRPAKRAAGRTAAADTPAYIRAVGPALDEADKAYLRRKLGRKLGKFALAIERTSVRVDDVNGPRRGIDKRCRIKVVLSGLPSIVVEERRHSLQAAMDGALSRVERAVRQAAGRRRMKPRRSTRYEERASVFDARRITTEREMKKWLSDGTRGHV